MEKVRVYISHASHITTEAIETYSSSWKINQFKKGQWVDKSQSMAQSRQEHFSFYDCRVTYSIIVQPEGAKQYSFEKIR